MKKRKNNRREDLLNPWGSLEGEKADKSLLKLEEAKRCSNCRCVVLNEWIRIKNEMVFCPDCFRNGSENGDQL